MTRMLKRFTKAILRGSRQWLVPQTVDLYGGQSVNILLHVGQRRAGQADLTGGAVAQNQFATIDATDWDDKVDRIPQKGDVVHWAGRRFAVESTQMVAPAGELAFYKCRLEG